MPNAQQTTDLYIFLSPYFAREQDENEQEKNAFIDAFSALPESLQDFLTAPETAAILEEIGDAFGLRLSQTEAVSYLVREVVLGNLSLKDLPAAIARECRVETPVAWDIANAVAAKLLMPIKDDLARWQAQKKTAVAPSVPPAATARITVPAGQTTPPHNIIDLRNKT